MIDMTDLSFADVQPGDLVTLVGREDDSYKVEFRVQWLEVAVGAGDTVSNCSALYTAGDDLYAETSWRLVKHEAAPVKEPAEGSVIAGKAGKKGYVFQRTGNRWMETGVYATHSWQTVLNICEYGFVVLREGFGND